MTPPLRYCLAALCLTLPLSAHAASSYPDRPLRLVVGFSPGGGADGIARVLAESMGRSLGQAVIVENRPGAQTTLAAASVANATADGYTLLLSLDSALGADKALFQTVDYDKDSFTPISKVATSFFVLAASNASGFRSFGDVIQQSKAGGAPIFIGSPGGAYMQIVTSDIRRLSGLALEDVPYKGGAPAAMAVVAGEVPLALMGPAALLPLARENKVQPIAMTRETRSDLTPGLPTLSESGVPGLGLSYWYGLLGPAGLPADVTQRLFDASHLAMADPEVRRKIELLGFEVTPSASAAEFGRTARTEGDTLRDRVRQADIARQ